MDKEIVSAWIQGRVAKIMGENNQRNSLERQARERLQEEAERQLADKLEREADEAEIAKIRKLQKDGFRPSDQSIRRNAAYMAAHLAHQEMLGVQRALAEILKDDESRIFSPPTGIITPESN